MRSSPVKTRVLLIGGTGRSGSTLLERIVGQVGGFFAAGELIHIWERSFRENYLCGCGESFADCPFWKAVVQAAFGDSGNVDIPAIISLQRSVSRQRHLPRLVLPSLRNRQHEISLARFRELLGRLYRAIQQVSGAAVIIDSSKSPVYGLILDGVENIDLYIVHIVRDSRAVAYSWTKKKLMPTSKGRSTYQSRYSPAKGALIWLWWNLLLEGFRRRRGRYLRMRYEDLVRRPRDSISRMLSLLGTPQTGSLQWLDDDAIELRTNHTVSGNPMRFARGKVRLKLDDEWRLRMRKSHKWLVTAVTGPLLVRYGYIWRHDCSAT